MEEIERSMEHQASESVEHESLFRFSLDFKSSDARKLIVTGHKISKTPEKSQEGLFTEKKELPSTADLISGSMFQPGVGMPA